MILLFIFSSIILAIFKCNTKRTEKPHTTLKTQAPKTESQQLKNEVQTKKTVNCVSEATFNKKINPPQSPYEEQITQKSISIKLNHDDDTLKNVESLRPEKPSINGSQQLNPDKELPKA